MNDKKDKRGLGESIGEGCGQVFETLGRGAFHVASTPVVGTGLRKMGNRLATGYTKEELRVYKRGLVKQVVKVARAGNANTSEQIRGACAVAEVPENLLDEIAERAFDAVIGKKQPKPSSTEAPAVPADGAFHSDPQAPSAAQATA